MSRSTTPTDQPCVSKRMRRTPPTPHHTRGGVRSELNSRSPLRFRKDPLAQIPDRSVPSDVAFTRARIAVLADGRFWHCYPTMATHHGATGTIWQPR